MPPVAARSLLALLLACLTACSGGTGDPPPQTSTSGPAATTPTSAAPNPSATATAMPTATATTAATAAPADAAAIDRLVDKLSKSMLWQNGTFPKIDLPQSASSGEVLRRMFELISFDAGKVTRHTVLAERDVKLGDASYKALVVDTDRGKQVVLMRFEGPQVGWWTRSYDP